MLVLKTENLKKYYGKGASYEEIRRRTLFV